MKKKTKLLIRDSFLSTILSCILVLILIFTIKNITFFNPFVQALTDFNLYDIYYSERFKPNDKINTDIILFNVEHRDRDILAVLLEKIIEQDPKVIGIDVIFEEKKEAFSDSILSKALKSNKIVNAFNIVDNNIKENHSYFQNGNTEGYVNFNFNIVPYNYVIRKFVGVSQELDYMSFGAQVAKQYLGDKWDVYDYDKKLKKERIIKYYGDYDKFITLDIDDFLDYENTPFLKDKIVIVGYLGVPVGNEFDIEDKFFTPLNKHLVGKSDKDMYGAVIHANIINMLINDDFIFELPLFWVAILTFISMYFTTMLLIKMDKKYKVSYRTRKHTLLFVFSIVLVGLALLLFKYGLAFEIVPIIIGTLFAGSYVKYYKHLVRYVKKNRKKWKWKTYVK
tara:strand:+ start:719 stop:1900 length:1182 start_codon:yes stop_codon:yes gene_type:complete